ncbi:MAG: hypothetical protein IM333_16560 [Microcystis sp. M048S1]|uniref:hypothetical protein n=1 Tax=unclassified Microcystis TaxID=2643300 RepID=UPI001194932E|nr:MULTISPECIES: hypothetical protein [unclassified Microcystis]MCA2900794.1 hypothetical protein [Microcystis sp. M035S1]MCA2721917.1 hypothetical protein [Microcystis sp. M176S2]MCA2728069.1 hypothetical protein [Microcystis sp. M166S2]MCA2730536.1 hypothetical protein [Microcystis sp. M162S2]MCA2747918.1 hypothetical protein [Microcystis sp. M155S2]
MRNPFIQCDRFSLGNCDRWWALLSFLERAIFVIKSRTINIYGSVGPWYDTDVWGEMGVIHSSQIKFDN